MTFIRKIFKFLTFSSVFVLSIFLTVAVSSFIAFSATPSVSTAYFNSLTIGKALADNFGLSIFANDAPYDFLQLDYQSSTAPTGNSYAVTLESNKAGLNSRSNNIAVLGQNAQIASGNYGRVGVLGQVITPTNGVGRGMLGFLEPLLSFPIAMADPNAIPIFAPIASGTSYGLYGDVGDVRFADVVAGNYIISSDGSIEMDGTVEFLDDLAVTDVGANSGTVTADKFILDANLYNNSQTTNTYFAAPFMASTLNKMLFTVTNGRGMGPDVTTTTATCPTGSVRVSCRGYMTGTSASTGQKLTRSSYRGTYPSGTNACTATAQKDGGGQVHVETTCMAAELP